MLLRGCLNVKSLALLSTSTKSRVPSSMGMFIAIRRDIGPKAVIQRRMELKIFLWGWDSTSDLPGHTYLDPIQLEESGGDIIFSHA